MASEPGQKQERDWRVRGWVLVAVGLFLVLFMGGIAWNVAPLMLNPEVEIEGTTFTGTESQARIFLGIFALVILFGLLSVVNGIHMVRTGRRSRAFTRITLTIAAILLVIGSVVDSGLI